jgi:iron complex transport system ATP-binding protein
MNAATIEARDLQVEVEATRLLDGVSISGRSGEVVGLIGPNGAGKTTLLRVLAGLMQGSAGSTALSGDDLKRMRVSEVAKKVGHVPQVSPDTHAFVTREIVMMGRYPHMGRFGIERDDDHVVVAAAMDATEISGFADRAVHSLSGGERQRVFIARAYAQQPQVLLLDEPTANLDIRHQMRTMTLIRSIADRGVSVIAAVHDLGLAARYCDRLELLDHGRIVSEGAPENVLTPEHIESVYKVRAEVHRDPFTNSLAISFVEPVDE